MGEHNKSVVEITLDERAARINTLCGLAMQSARKAVGYARQAGEELLAAKACCRHGEWLQWLAEKCPDVSERTAQAWMRLARGWDTLTAKYAVTADLTLDGALRLLAQKPDDSPAAAEPPTSPRVYVEEPRQVETPPPVICTVATRVTEIPPPLTGHFRTNPDGGSTSGPGTPTPEATDASGVVGEAEPPVVVEPVSVPLPMAERPIAGGRLGKPGEFVTLDEWDRLDGKARRGLLFCRPVNRAMNRQEGDSIEWARWSWNPVTGCKHECPYCYARDIAERLYAPRFAPALWWERLDAPRHVVVPEGAKEDLGLKNVFVCSMADLFGRWVPREWIDAVLQTVRENPQWNFLFLTKFPIRLAEFEFPDNAWVGTTVDCQVRVANAEKAFRKVKAGVKWLSCEPLIEPLKFADLSAFDWLVIGGASRSNQTPEWHPPRQWVNDLERAATEAGVEFYEKSNLLSEIRGYPGLKYQPVTQAPEQLRYLPQVEA